MIMDPRNKHAGQFYVAANISLDGIPRYLHSDAIVRGSTFNGGEPSGYFATQSEAQAAIDEYQKRQAEAANIETGKQPSGAR